MSPIIKQVESISIPNDDVLINGFTLGNYLGSLTLKTKESFFILKNDSILKDLNLPRDNKPVYGNNLVEYKGSFVATCRGSNNERVLCFYNQSWSFKNIPERYLLAEDGFIQVWNNFLSFTVIDTKKETNILCLFDGENYIFIDPEAYVKNSELALNNKLPKYYCGFNMSLFHEGLHLVLRDKHSIALPYSFKEKPSGIGREYEFVIFQGLNGKFVPEGTCSIGNEVQNSFFINFNKNNKLGFYHHVSGGAENINLPQGFEVATGYPMVNWGKYIVMVLNNELKKPFIFLYSLKTGFLPQLQFSNSCRVTKFCSIMPLGDKIYVTDVENNLLLVFSET